MAIRYLKNTSLEAWRAEVRRQWPTAYFSGVFRQSQTDSETARAGPTSQQFVGCWVKTPYEVSAFVSVKDPALP
jgi:hypothetical protein